MTRTVERVGSIGHQKPGASPIRQWTNAGLTRRRDESHDARHINEQERFVRDVERAHVIAKSRRKGAFKIVKCFDIIVQRLKPQLRAHFSTSTPLLTVRYTAA